MRCKNIDGTYTVVQWKYYHNQCTRIQDALGICSNLQGAYLPAITVCTQALFF
jgi:hypothetical protein